MFYEDERFALFIDGAHLHAAAKALGFGIDYRSLRQSFCDRGRLVRASYYAPAIAGDDSSRLRPLVDWLQYNGFATVARRLPDYADGQRRRPRCALEVDLVVDALELAPHMEHAVLFLGSGDYVPLVRSLQRGGVRVTIVSTINSNPPMTSDDLRRRADAFIDLEELRDVIGRVPRESAHDTMPEAG